MEKNIQIKSILGMYDIPEIQRQDYFEVDLVKSNIAIFGSSMSGKTNLVSLLINCLHKKCTPNTEQVFILDFSGALRDYENFPLISAYYDNSNEEYVKRIFKILETILKDNTKALGSSNFQSGDADILHTTFIIENLNAFVDEGRYSAYHEKFGRLARDGRSKGISIVFTATDTKGINRYLLSFEQKIALNLSSEKYSEIFSEKVGDIVSTSGRGYANVTEKLKNVTGTFNMNRPYEVQILLSDNIKDRNSHFMKCLELKFKYDSETGTYGKQVKKYVRFPQDLTIKEFDRLAQYTDINEKLILPVDIGLDYVEFSPVSVDFGHTRAVAVYGKKEFGKTNLLSVLLAGIIKKRPDYRIVFFDDGRNQLNDLYEYYYNQGINCEIISKFKTDDNIKLSPIQQFYKLIHEEYMNLDPAGYGNDEELLKIYPQGYSSGLNYDEKKPTIFVIQSKSAYIYVKYGTAENFMLNVLPQMIDLSEENDYIFIFSDVQKITDINMREVFNSTIKTAFLLDNIAEFAGDRGKTSVFGEMDTKELKEEYAKCELGDGYFYDVEADTLKKVKFIKSD